MTATYVDGVTLPMLGDLVECVRPHPASGIVLVGNKFVVHRIELCQDTSDRDDFIGFSDHERADWSPVRFKLIHRAGEQKGPQP